MKTLARLFALIFAATLFAAPVTAPAQQKQDTMDKKESPKKKKRTAKPKRTKKSENDKTGDAQKAPAPGPK